MDAMLEVAQLTVYIRTSHVARFGARSATVARDVILTLQLLNTKRLNLDIASDRDVDRSSAPTVALCWEDRSISSLIQWRRGNISSRDITHFL